MHYLPWCILVHFPVIFPIVSTLTIILNFILYIFIINNKAYLLLFIPLSIALEQALFSMFYLSVWLSF